MPPRLPNRLQHRTLAELALAGLVLGLLAALASAVLAAPPAFAVVAAGVYTVIALLVARSLPGDRGLGPANRVTLARGVMICLVAGALADPQWLAARAHWLVATAALALAADGVDGWVARRTGSASAFGARFDMELDAFLILLLCLCVIAVGKAGAWVLAIGTMRYLFVAAMGPWPWIGAELPESFRRKAVCVWQVASLVLVLWPTVSPPLAAALLASALMLLTVSFAQDLWWLYRRAHHPA